MSDCQFVGVTLLRSINQVCAQWCCFTATYNRVVLLPCPLRLGVSLQACLLQIVGYRNLIAEVEKLRREPYDSENPQHEEMLLKVGAEEVLRGTSFIQVSSKQPGL